MTLEYSDIQWQSKPQTHRRSFILKAMIISEGRKGFQYKHHKNSTILVSHLFKPESDHDRVQERRLLGVLVSMKLVAHFLEKRISSKYTVHFTIKVWLLSYIKQTYMHTYVCDISVLSFYFSNSINSQINFIFTPFIVGWTYFILVFHEI